MSRGASQRRRTSSAVTCERTMLTHRAYGHAARDGPASRKSRTGSLPQPARSLAPAAFAQLRGASTRARPRRRAGLVAVCPPTDAAGRASAGAAADALELSDLCIRMRTDGLLCTRRRPVLLDELICVHRCQQRRAKRPSRYTVEHLCASKNTVEDLCTSAGRRCVPTRTRGVCRRGQEIVRSPRPVARRTQMRICAPPSPQDRTTPRRGRRRAHAPAPTPPPCGRSRRGRPRSGSRACSRPR